MHRPLERAQVPGEHYGAGKSGCMNDPDAMSRRQGTANINIKIL